MPSSFRAQIVWILGFLGLTCLQVARATLLYFTYEIDPQTFSPCCQDQRPLTSLLTWGLLFRPPRGKQAGRAFPLAQGWGTRHKEWPYLSFWVLSFLHTGDGLVHQKTNYITILCGSQSVAQGPQGVTKALPENMQGQIIFIIILKLHFPFSLSFLDEWALNVPGYMAYIKTDGMQKHRWDPPLVL